MCVQHILPYPWSLTATFLALYLLRASGRMLKTQVLLKSWTKSCWFKTMEAEAAQILVGWDSINFHILILLCSTSEFNCAEATERTVL